MNHYIHTTPGRLRIRTPLFKKSHEAQKAKTGVKKLKGVESVDVNTVTGSIIIKYDNNRIPQENLMQYLEKQGYIDKENTITNDQYVHQLVAKVGTFIWESAFGAYADVKLDKSPLSYLTVFI